MVKTTELKSQIIQLLNDNKNTGFIMNQLIAPDQ